MLPQLTMTNYFVLFLGATVATTLLTPFVIKLARRVGAIDCGGYRKINVRSVPRMGGLSVALTFLLVCFFGIYRPAWLFGPTAIEEKDFVILLAGGGMILILGIIDDIHGLSAKSKFLIQAGVAVLVLVAHRGIESIDLPVLGDFRFSPFTGALLSVFWIVGIINAFNLIDGMDGLASGVALVSSLGMGAIALVNGQSAIFMLCLVFAGSLGGFLLFNFHPAKCFLGDTGSMFIGYVLAMLALMCSPRATASFLPATVLVLGLPIFDTLTSMARRILRGRSPFSGDRGHTHHRLLDHGYSQRQAALLLYGVALLCSVTAVLFQAFYDQSIKPLLSLSCFGLVFGVMAWANGFLRPRHFLRVAHCRARNSRLASFSRYASLALKGRSSVLRLNDVLQLGCRVMNLKFLEVAAEGQPGLLIGYYGEDGDDAGKPEGSAVCESVQVATASGQRLNICYQMAPGAVTQAALDEDTAETVKLERQDIMACIASVFNGARIELLTANESLEEEIAGEEAGLSNIQDMREIAAQTPERMKVSALTVD